MKDDRLQAVKTMDKGISILVKKFTVKNATLIDAGSIESVTKQHEGKRLSIAQITDVAQAITRVYRQQGYMLAYAFVPAQDVQDGVIVIKAVEGDLGEIVVSGNKHYSSEFISKHIANAVKGQSLKTDDLERAILILNSFPSLHTQVSLKAGQTPGTSDIMVRAKDSKHFHGGISYNNFGSKSVSRNRLSPWIEYGNFLRTGDLVTLNGITGLDRIDFRQIAYGKIDYTTPIAHNGMKLGLYYSQSRYKVGEQLTALNIHGKSRTAGVYLSYPLIRQVNSTLNIRGGLDYKNLTDFILGNIRGEDRIRTASVGLSYNFIDYFYGSNALNFSYVQGLPNILGGDGKNEQGTTRLGADGNFSKLTLGFSRTQPVSDYGRLVFKASGQWSNAPLFSAEQFGIGGEGSVRGFTPTLFSADSGYTLSVEAVMTHLIPDILPVFNQPELVLFFDHGGVFRNQVQPGEHRSDYLGSIGIGVRLYTNHGFSLLIDQAFPKVVGSFAGGNGLTHVQASFNF